jgi:hypothetical protein
MKCPHCLTAFHDKVEYITVGEDSSKASWHISKRVCPECNEFILSLLAAHPYRANREFFIYPKAPSRTSLAPEVPDVYTSDYREACLTLADSPKASAALSRRCLQHLLREEANVKHGNLADEIQQVLDASKLPSHLLESLDAVRNIGNFAAHPIKSKASGEIIDVEPGEAEWNLDVLESLFDYFFVQPSVIKKKREALNKKLEDAGKPKMK